jgi:hypothetical protein
LREAEGVPKEPLSRDDETLGLWRFEKLEEGGLPDDSALRNPARPVTP